jgi:hypothetical protein
MAIKQDVSRHCGRKTSPQAMNTGFDVKAPPPQQGPVVVLPVRLLEWS